MAKSMERSFLKDNRALLGTIIALFGVALLTVIAFYDPLHLTSANPESRDPQGFATTPVWIWFIGAFVLGAVLAYGILQNRKRSRSDIARSDAATRRLCASEEEKNTDRSSPT
jgi:Na+/proline symporter